MSAEVWAANLWGADFLGTPGVGFWMFVGLSVASFATNYMSIVAGTAGGLLLLVIMAGMFPPSILVPLHTLVQLGSGTSRVFMMWDWVLKGTLVPFAVGAAIGAALGASVFVSLPEGLLMGFLAIFIIIMTWTPSLGRYGSVSNRFAAVGFVATFLGVFVSATGTIVGPFVASASPDRRNHAATLAALMSITHIAKVAAFLTVGIALGAYVPLMGGMIAGGMLGNWAGERTLSRMREEWFRTFFKVAMTLMSLRLLWLSARDLGFI